MRNNIETTSVERKKESSSIEPAWISFMIKLFDEIVCPSCLLSEPAGNISNTSDKCFGLILFHKDVTLNSNDTIPFVDVQMN